MNEPPRTGAGAVIHVAQGRVTGYQGIRFGGVGWIPATGEKPGRVRVAIRWESGEANADLRAGDTVAVYGQTWQLHRLRHDGRSWQAELTRIE